MTHGLEDFWSLLGAGQAGSLFTPDARCDDPLFDAADAAVALPRLAEWYRARAAGTPVHLATTSDERRVVVEHVCPMKDGLVWLQGEQRSAKAERFDLATAVVGVRGSGGALSAARVYFGTWSVLDGASRLRKGPICPEEREATRATMASMPVIARYFELLATGDPALADMFEPDGHFREPANNYACGGDQLREHFQHILKLGGVGIEFLTATREGARIALELQTVLWGSKKMPVPQAGLAAYEVGSHGKIRGARVYDSVVPPEL